jgi:hypothetical protein
VRHDQALDLLQRGWAPHLAAPAYDPEQALVLCRVHAHKPGLLFLYDKLRMYKELLQVGGGGDGEAGGGGGEMGLSWPGFLGGRASRQYVQLAAGRHGRVDTNALWCAGAGVHG